MGGGAAGIRADYIGAISMGRDKHMQFSIKSGRRVIAALLFGTATVSQVYGQSPAANQPSDKQAVAMDKIAPNLDAFKDEAGISPAAWALLGVSLPNGIDEKQKKLPKTIE